MSEGAFVVLSTFGSAEEARKIAHTLVEERLCACANLLPPVESIYRWKGAVETAAETLVLFKTSETQYPALESRLRALHSYETPEIVALRIQAGAESYLSWIRENCAPENPAPPPP